MKILMRHFEHKDIKIIQDKLYPDHSEIAIGDLITEWNSGACQGRFFEMFAIESDNKIVGYVSIYGKSRSIASAGIEIFAEERKKGFAYYAMAELLKYASEKGYHIMLNQVRKDNLPSMRLHEKLGFESDGYTYRNQKNKEVFLYLKLL